MLSLLWSWLSGLAAVLWWGLWGYSKQRPHLLVLVVLAVLRSLGTTVQSGRAGVLFVCGRARKVLGPGFHPLIPILQQVKQTPVRSVTLDLPRQRVSTA